MLSLAARLGHRRAFSSGIASTPFERVSGKIVADPDSKLAKKVAKRVVCDVSFLQVLEDELRGNSAGALGKAQRALDTAYGAWMEFRAEHPVPEPGDVELTRTHNDLRREALRRRDDLMIQWQACGFRLKNRDIITRAYPVPPVWPDHSRGT